VLDCYANVKHALIYTDLKINNMLMISSDYHVINDIIDYKYHSNKSALVLVKHLDITTNYANTKDYIYKAGINVPIQGVSLAVNFFGATVINNQCDLSNICKFTSSMIARNGRFILIILDGVRAFNSDMTIYQNQIQVQTKKGFKNFKYKCILDQTEHCLVDPVRVELMFKKAKLYTEIEGSLLSFLETYMSCNQTQFSKKELEYLSLFKFYVFIKK
jgi:hypothetical protein